MFLTNVKILIFIAMACGTNSFERSLNYEMHKKVLNPALCENQLKSRTLFAEANANVPSNIKLKGPRKFFANFDECLSIADKVPGVGLTGKYCRVKVSVPSIPPADVFNNKTHYIIMLEKQAEKRKLFKTVSEYGCVVDNINNESPFEKFTVFHVDICIPAACATDEAMEWVFNKNITFDGITIPGVRYDSEFCSLPGDKYFSKSDVVGIVLISILLLVTILSTAYDISSRAINRSSKPDATYRLCSSFSVYSNARQVIACRSSEDIIECSDGIRVISLVWVLLIHTAQWIHGREKFYDNNNTKWNDFEHFVALPGHLAVDTFFMLSGLFLVYTTVNKFTGETFLQNLHIFYIRRLLRIWPLVAVCLLATSTFYIHIADGPNWNDTAKIVNGCRLTWWLKLLFIQNFVKFCSFDTYLCLGHFWYLAVDMQFFAVSPLVLVWLFGRHRPAWVALALTVLLSFALCATISFVFDHTYTGLLFDPYNAIPLNIVYQYSKDYNQQYYHNPLARIPPYAVGILTGYILHCCRKTKLQIHKRYICILWPLSLLIIFGIIGVHKPVYEGPLSQTVHNFLNGFSRGFFGFAVAWIVAACHKGYGGPINWFLSLRVWKLPSRLSYAMYIVHVPVLEFDKALDTNEEPNRHLDISAFLSVFLRTFIFAFVLTILVETPILNLQKLLFEKKTNNSKLKKHLKANMENEIRAKVDTMQTTVESRL